MADDADLDEWIAGLSGKRPARSTEDDAVVFRDALRYRARTAADLSDAEKALLARLLKRTATTETTAGTPIPTAHPRSVRSSAPYARRWALAASGAGLAIIAGALIESIPQKAPTGPDMTVRGAVAHIVVPSPNPPDRAHAIEDELTTLGFRPHRVTRPGAVPIVITVSVSAARLSVFGPWLKVLGESARAAGDYEIEITAVSGSAGP